MYVLWKGGRRVFVSIFLSINLRSFFNTFQRALLPVTKTIRDWALHYYNWVKKHTNITNWVEKKFSSPFVKIFELSAGLSILRVSSLFLKQSVPASSTNKQISSKNIKFLSHNGMFIKWMMRKSTRAQICSTFFLRNWFLYWICCDIWLVFALVRLPLTRTTTPKSEDFWSSPQHLGPRLFHFYGNFFDKKKRKRSKSIAITRLHGGERSFLMTLRL